MRCRASGDMEACIKKVEELRTYLNDIEIEVHSVLDVQNCSGLLKGLVN